MKKRRILFVCIAAMMFIGCSFFICSAETIASGDCGAEGNNLTWTLDENGTVVITGEGDMADFKRYGPWKIYEQYSEYSFSLRTINGVILDDRITSIGENAFYDCEIKSVELPSSLSQISMSAFKRCSQLETIIIPDGVKTIGGGAFYDCRNLSKVVIPDGACIGETSSENSGGWNGGLFSGCEKLQTAGPINSGCDIEYGFSETFPKGFISESESITSAIVPEGIEYIDTGAFAYCPNLETVVIPSSVKSTSASFGSGSPFCNCPKLKTVGPYGGNYNIQFKWTEEIPVFFFSNCHEITSVVIPEGITEIHFDAFFDCQNLEKVVLPRSLINIGADSYNYHGIFSYCYNLKTAGPKGSGCDIEFSWDEIVPPYAFYLCDSLEKVTIPDGITQLGTEAFRYCKKMTDITIPSSVSIISFDAFSGCNELADVYYSGSIEDWEEIKILSGNDCLENATIHYNSSGSSSKKIKVLGERFDHDLIYYSKAWNSTEYSPELAHLMMIMANAAYDPTKVKQGYKDLGLSQWEPYNYDKQGSVYGTENVCYSIGSTVDDDGTICLLVTIRGSGSITDVKQGTLDWIGNLDLASASQTGFAPHNNFNQAAKHVYEGIDGYLYQKFRKNIGDNNIKYFITGHSRGAAVANLVEYRLDTLGKEDIYGYNFAVPDTGIFYKNTNVKAWDNIFNISNLKDIVSYVPGSVADAMFSLKQIVTSGTLDNKWQKWGISVWFEDGMEGSVGGEAHDPERYLAVMRERASINSYTEEPKFHESIQIGLGRLNYKIYATYCPVDVELVNKNGKVIASVVDGIADYHDSHFGDVMIATIDNHKMFAVPSNANYSLRIVGTDKGTMDYYVAETSILTEETTVLKTYEGVSISEEKSMLSKENTGQSADDEKLFVLDENGKIVSDINEDGTEKPHIHDWDTDYTTDTSATCTAEGTESIHCSLCDEVKEGSERSIPAIGHKYGAWKTTKEPTYTEEGSREKVCSKCGDKVTESIPRLKRTGWQKIDGDWYYFKSDGQKATNTWAKDSKGWCWMDASGCITKSKWIKTGGEWYYLKSNGYMAANEWAKDSGGWYWMNGSGRIAKNVWAKDSGGWYWMNGSGRIAKNAWAKDSKGWCWMGSNGRMVKSKWVKYRNDWYYLNASGYMVTGTQKIGGKTYRFDKSGKWIS